LLPLALLLWLLGTPQRRRRRLAREASESGHDETVAGEPPDKPQQ
jgi:hypothetical protein